MCIPPYCITFTSIAFSSLRKFPPFTYKLFSSFNLHLLLKIPFSQQVLNNPFGKLHTQRNRIFHSENSGFPTQSERVRWHNPSYLLRGVHPMVTKIPHLLRSEGKRKEEHVMGPTNSITFQTSTNAWNYSRGAVLLRSDTDVFSDPNKTTFNTFIFKQCLQQNKPFEPKYKQRSKLTETLTLHSHPLTLFTKHSLGQVTHLRCNNDTCLSSGRIQLWCSFPCCWNLRSRAGSH